MSDDIGNNKGWIDYEKFLKQFPRAERRRILKAHFNIAIKANKKQKLAEYKYYATGSK